VGSLAAACHPARVITLVLSDVPGDAPMDIASGPTVGDPTTCADALEIVQRYGIELPAHVRAVLESGAGESVKPGDPRLAGIETRMVAAPQQALEVAAAVARQHGYAPHILSDAIEGEARDVGKVLAALALQVAERGQPFKPPCAILSGGETTVTLRGKGRGGRNVECLAVLCHRAGGHTLHPRPDGRHRWRRWCMKKSPGLTLTPTRLNAPLRKRHEPAPQPGQQRRTHGFFQSAGRLGHHRPDATNVNDFRAILIG
jgi:glycerate 2-kinase